MLPPNLALSFFLLLGHPRAAPARPVGLAAGQGQLDTVKEKACPSPGPPTHALTHTSGEAFQRKTGVEGRVGSHIYKKKNQPPNARTHLLNHARRLPGPGPGRYLRVRRARRDGQGGGPGLGGQGERGRAWWAQLSSDWGGARTPSLIFWSAPGPPARGLPPQPARPTPTHAHGIYHVYLLTPPRQEVEAAIDAKVSDDRGGGE